MQRLTNSIVNGGYAEGDMLPREVDLAEKFDISRGTARETIRALEERGLISVRHGRGATVNPPEDWDVFAPEVLSAVLNGPRKMQILNEYLECRRILEVEAAGFAAERAEAHQIAALTEAFQAMKAATKLAPSEDSETAFHEADLAFHQALFGAAHNQALSRLVAKLHSALLLARLPLARPEHRVKRAIPEHKAILDAVAAGDKTAAQTAMSRHLATVGKYLSEMGNISQDDISKVV